MKQNAFTGVLDELDGFVRLNELMKAVSGTKTALCTGVADSQKCHLAAGLAIKRQNPLLFVTFSELKAKDAFEDLSYFLGDGVYLYPSKDPVFYSADVRSGDIIQNRFNVIDAILKNEATAIVLSVEALFDRLIPKSDFSSYILELREGDELSLNDFIEKLVLMGFERSPQVYSCGQFAVRGGIIDLFTGVYKNPIRIELWGDEVDSIRLLDAGSQRSVEKLQNVRIFPVRELLYKESEVAGVTEAIEKELEEVLKEYGKKGLKNEAANLKEHINHALERFRTQINFSGADNFIHYFLKEKTCFLDYLPDDTFVFIDEPSRFSERADNVRAELEESIKSRITGGYILPSQADTQLGYQELLQKLKTFPLILLSAFTTTIRDFTLSEICDFSVKSSPVIKQQLSILVDELKYYTKQKYRILILAGAKTRAERLMAELRDEGFSTDYSDELEKPLEPGVLTLTKGSLCKGFEYPLIKFAVVTDKEIFGEERARRPKKKKKGARIDSFLDLNVGDYVVHDNHGVGIYRGIEKIVSEGISRDYMKISYADGGSLFVNTSQMDMIQKYIGGEDAKPKINKLGGADWGRAKSKVRTAVKELAVDLAKLYAKRQSSLGFTYSPDTVWQTEFEQLFPYEETDDQIAAISDVKHDMESPIVMDRLICGDVGYGKTEIALRAAFKAVSDGKQVAVLVPTTILAQQHYTTFSQRLMDFPVRADLLSRFRSPKQQRETIAGLKKGSVDIVIGTHRLLSKDIIFKDLGLIVVDEEQRFGVLHKEKLKELRENVDVITLTATPIPRTLHMSLSGIRDMSILEEPPHERQPVQTYVMEYSPELIRDAVHRELARNGQVYFLHNRVRSIEDATEKLRELVPEASIGFAHGQMNEHELENVMMDFIEGMINVLVCTTIIETGLDIPNVNTIIVADSDKMGLSQLYQLRGRVGRSNRIAYAYLMYRRDKVLTEASEKRLQTIREFTEFGSGFKIAMRDLEIRGSGNLLGPEQSGHMSAVGYDTYCRLLSEAVQEERGIAPENGFETTIDINIDAYIPQYYIEDELQRLEIYKKISLISDEGDYFDVQEEIEDRFGNIPACVQNLLDLAYLKATAHSKQITAIKQSGDILTMIFKPDAEADPLKISALIDNNKDRLSFRLSLNPSLSYKIKEGENNLINVNNLLKLI